VQFEGTVGTFQYMAPEQLQGKPADARTDIFAFGVVVYEMVTGQKAFAANSQAGLIGAILKDTPAPMAASQPLSRPGLDRLVKKCLAKSPDARWHSTRDLHDELEWVATAGAGTGGAPTQTTTSASKLVVLGAFLAVTAAAIAGGVVAWNVSRTPSDRPIARLLLSVEPAEALGPTARPSRTAIALSPDGRTIVFVGGRGATTRLFIRRLDQAVAEPIAGTDGGSSPFWSPDGQWVGFWSGGDRKLKKVSLAGGPAVAICDVETPNGPFGVSWGAHGTIAFSVGRNGIQRVSAGGGAPQALTTLDSKAGEREHVLPAWLPG
jgi:hypothetical protein